MRPVLRRCRGASGQADREEPAAGDNGGSQEPSSRDGRVQERLIVDVGGRRHRLLSWTGVSSSIEKR